MKRILPRGLLAATLAALVPGAQAALDVAGIDRTVDACTDFYQFANKSWLAATVIPSDRARWGTFEIIDQRNEKVLLETINREIRTPPKDQKYAAAAPNGWRSSTTSRA
jgi:putative endopeptidase